MRTMLVGTFVFGLCGFVFAQAQGVYCNHILGSDSLHVYRIVQDLVTAVGDSTNYRLRAALFAANHPSDSICAEEILRLETNHCEASALHFDFVAVGAEEITVALSARGGLLNLRFNSVLVMPLSRKIWVLENLCAQIDALKNLGVVQ